jgi:tRNA pseudouridine38-40 synthase
MRIALGLEYNGTNYHGWQQQNGLLTVQSSVQLAVSKVADHPIIVTCAGRTDVGVHAKDQVIHFDTNANRKLDAWILGVNYYLPNDICIKWAANVDESFHARFSAIARHYNYVIYNQKTRPAILANQVAWHFAPLNAEAMHLAAQYLLGEQDFSSFRSSYCQSSTPMRNVHNLNVTRNNDLVIIDIKANAFLQHMVRNIVGLLLTVGENKRPPEWAKEVLAKRDRRAASYAASACGLYLTKVYYPATYHLPLLSSGSVKFYIF